MNISSVSLNNISKKCLVHKNLEVSCKNLEKYEKPKSTSLNEIHIISKHYIHTDLADLIALSDANLDIKY